MSVLIRVEDEPPRSRLDYLRHVVADTFVPFDLQVDADDDLKAQLLTGQVGTLDVTKVSAPPLKAVRTPRLIRVSDPESFKLEVPVRGRSLGFTDPAHFSRVFRAAYDLAPTEYRQAASTTGPP